MLFENSKKQIVRFKEYKWRKRNIYNIQYENQKSINKKFGEISTIKHV